jgi:hypothetical protein
MCMKIRLGRFIPVAFAIACCSPLTAQSQYQEPQPPGSPGAPGAASISSRPSANNEIYAKLKTQCETDVSCGKASGDVCANAAAVILGDDPPDALRDMTQIQKNKIALRLLERGVDSSNLAAGRAFDLYDKTDMLGLLSGGVSDPYRANELMDMMIKKNYPGGILRKARSSLAFFSLTVSEADKKESCATAKKFVEGGKLDSDSLKIANELLDTAFCKGPPQAPMN